VGAYVGLRIVTLALALLTTAFVSSKESSVSADWKVPASEAQLISQVETYFRKLKYLVAEFHQFVGNVVYGGKVWISKDGTLKVKIVYTFGVDQEILMVGDSIGVTDHSSGKKYTYSVSSVPLYTILTGKQKLTPDTVKVIENSTSGFVIMVKGSSVCSGGDLILIFTKYELTGNIEGILGWKIGDGPKQTEFRFVRESVRVGDKRQIPDGTFPNGKS
jgi:hypothetical protein